MGSQQAIEANYRVIVAKSSAVIINDDKCAPSAYLFTLPRFLPYRSKNATLLSQRIRYRAKLLLNLVIIS